MLVVGARVRKRLRNYIFCWFDIMLRLEEDVFAASIVVQICCLHPHTVADQTCVCVLEPLSHHVLETCAGLADVSCIGYHNGWVHLERIVLEDWLFKECTF